MKTITILVLCVAVISLSFAYMRSKSLMNTAIDQSIRYGNKCIEMKTKHIVLMNKHNVLQEKYIVVMKQLISIYDKEEITPPPQQL